MRRKRENMILQLSIGILICLQVMMGNNAFASDLNLLPKFELTNFETARAPRPSYDIRFTAFNGKALEEPIYFSQVSPDAISLPLEAFEAGQTLINRIGTAIIDENQYKAETLHSRFQEEYLTLVTMEQTAEYEIILIPPIRHEGQRGDNGRPRSITLLEVYWVEGSKSPLEISNLSN